MSSIPQGAAVRARIGAPLAAALLGFALLYVAGFAHIDAVHDGAHDARHSAPLPCQAHDAAAPSLLTTAIANVALAAAFALFLGAALSLRPPSNWRRGLLWGAAGYVVFFVAPSLGLPPELPGTQSAALHDRQLWWFGCVAFTALGVGTIAFARHPASRVAGVLLLIAPHVLGAPQPVAHGGTAPAALASEFVRATYLANAVFWLALGGLVGALLDRFTSARRLTT